MFNKENKHILLHVTIINQKVNKLSYTWNDEQRKNEEAYKKSKQYENNVSI